MTSAMASKRFRFSVGDRVCCNLGDDGWAPGTVVATDYREDHWPDGKTAPYQVALDDSVGGHLIFAPADVPQVIRGEGDAPLETLSIPKSGGDAAAAIQALESELDALRRLPFVESADSPICMTIAESEGEVISPTSSTGPFLVRMRLQGPQGSAYNSSYVVHAKCNAAWPQSPPELRFCGVIHHVAVADGGKVRPEALQDSTEAAQMAAAGQGKKLGPLCAAFCGLYSMLRDESQSRSQLQRLNSERLRVISSYKPQRRHPELFNDAQGWDRKWFDPDFLKAVDAGTGEAWRQLMREESWEVFSCPMLTPQFCDMFIEEIYSFYASGLPARRPNSMNNYGVIVNEIGLEPMLDRLQQEFLQPLAHALFPGIGSQFDHHHSFIVRYKVGEDLGLDMHTDDSDITFNVCLGKEFSGAGLQFCGNQATAAHRQSSAVYHHCVGRCVVHVGHRRHGADDITSGERLNLIIWNHNSEYRKSATFRRFHVQGKDYEKEVAPPDKHCVSFTHDRDYGVFQQYTPKTEAHRGRGWCPPRFAEYDGFKAEARVGSIEKRNAQS